MRRHLLVLWRARSARRGAIIAAGLIAALCLIGMRGPWLTGSAAVEAGQPVMFGRWTPDPKGANPLVPRVDRSTIGAYGDLMGWDQFGIGRFDAGRLVSLEEWVRDRVEADPGLMVGDVLVASLPVPPGGMRFFMQTAPGVWAEVAAEATAGESLFIRLRMVRDLRVDRQVPVAEEIRQYVMRRSTYHYAPDGRLTAVTRAERDTDFTPQRISIGADGGTAPLP
jgi:hypothetical protein